jgi:hypothetical protein
MEAPKAADGLIGRFKIVKVLNQGTTITINQPPPWFIAQYLQIRAAVDLLLSGLSMKNLGFCL